MTAALASAGCLEEATTDEVEAAPQEIINGTVVNAEGSGWVLVYGAGGCSGTLLHNEWVLTAKHCGTAAGSTVVMGSQSRTVDQVLNHPTLDVALAHLSTPMIMGGSATQWRRALRRSVLPAGTTVQCYGYGYNTFGGGFGTLRTAALTISSSANPNYAFNANTWGQIQWRGDSGGGCIDGAGNALFVQSACSYHEPSGPVVSCWGPRADVIADWADQIVPRNSFESYNFPGHYIRHYYFMGNVTTMSSPLDRADATFKLVPGLADSNCRSFQSVNFPGNYLRHQDFRIKLHPYSDDTLYRNDATFCLRPGLANSAFTSFESRNLPGFFVRHANFELYLAKETSDVFKADATFRVAAPLQ